MKVVRTGILLILAFSGLLLLAQPSQANSVFYSFAVSHPGYCYYRPWAASFGFGFGYHHPYYYIPPYYYYGYYPRYYTYRYYAAGEIRTEVKPSIAKVYVDGDYAGVADDYDGWWQRLRLTAGRHRITFRAPGYVPYVVNMRIVPAEDYHLKYQMEPGNDSITEDQMRPEMNSRDNEFYRDRDHRDHDQDYSYRRHDEDHDQDQDRDRSYDRNRRSDNNRGEDRANNETLYLSVVPRDATIYIDGNYFGTADTEGGAQIKVLLPRGSHKIEVVRPGYKSYSQDIDLDASVDNHISIVLEAK